MEFDNVKIVSSFEETEIFAFEFAASIKEGDFIALIGNLGSGKTFFVKNVCKYFNIFNVNSPTFAIVNEYYGTKTIYHFDFYRIKKLEELYDIGFHDYLNNRKAIIFVEWAELMCDILPDKRTEIYFEYLSKNKRKIGIKKLK